MAKSQLLASTALRPPIAIVVTADDGGVGKTHVAIQIVTAFKLASLPLDLFQLDTKQTLEKKSGEPVTSLVLPDRYDASTDVTSGADVITPWYRAATSTAETGRSCLLEVGGALAPLFHAGVTDFDLEEDIGLLDMQVVAMVVTKAGGDAASQLVREIQRWERHVPSAQIIIVANEMSGAPLVAAAELDKAARAKVFSMFERYPVVRVPRLNARTMVLYERLPVLPSTVVSWYASNYAEALARTGKPRDEAKRFVRDVAAWTGVIQEEVEKVLPFLALGQANG